MDIVQQLQGQLQGAQEQIKKLSGDLQTAQRESVSSRQRTEVEKFKGKLKEHELDSKTASRSQVDKLTNAVKLEVEKSRLRGQSQADREKLQAKGGK